MRRKLSNWFLLLASRADILWVSHFFILQELLDNDSVCGKVCVSWKRLINELHICSTKKFIEKIIATTSYRGRLKFDISLNGNTVEITLIRHRQTERTSDAERIGTVVRGFACKLIRFASDSKREIRESKPRDFYTRLEFKREIYLRDDRLTLFHVDTKRPGFSRVVSAGHYEKPPCCSFTSRGKGSPFEK